MLVSAYSVALVSFPTLPLLLPLPLLTLLASQGPGYPLWIVPALVFLIVLGSGSLATHPRVILRSQNGKLTEVGETISAPIAVFGHTSRGRFLINEELGNLSSVAASATQLTLYFEANIPPLPLLS
jgi:hypothetical protein